MMHKNSLFAIIIVTFVISANFYITYNLSADAYEILEGEESFDFEIYSVADKVSLLDKPWMPYDLSSLDLPILKTLSRLDYVPGEVIVKFKQEIVDEAFFCFSDNLIDVNIPSISLLNNKHSLIDFKEISKESSSVYTNGLYKLSFSENVDINSIIRSYENDPNVEYAEPNYIYEIFLVPNDPYFDIQWALNQSNDCDIDAPDAWDITIGSSDVVIAVIDTGVDCEHGDLSDNIWINNAETVNGEDTDSNNYIDDIRGWDFYNGDNDPRDDHGHGTHCAGIIGAVGNNSIGISGVCWNISIMPLKAFGSGGYGYADDIAAAIIYATDNGADIISMSWGGYSESLTVKSAIEYAYSNNIVLVAAAGNDNINRKVYPAYYDEVISVAATDKSDSKASFSNWGPWIDVAAPGVDIYSTMPTDYVFLNHYGYTQNYSNMSGTSMACPHVAGIAGLLLSNNSSLSNIQIKNILKTSANPINPMTSDHYIGMGCVNAYSALLNDTIPLAIINTSLKNSELSENVYINGTANGSYFTNYSVYYGRGFYPESWTTIVSNNEAKVNDSTLAIWNTSELPADGFYTIKLVVNSSQNMHSIDTVVVKVNNVIETLYVGSGHPYTTIHSAVIDAGNGDTVFISNGTYIESVMINSNIEIIGEDKNNTVVIGNSTAGYVFWIDSNRCDISNLNIKNTDIGLVYTSNNNSLIQNNIFNNTALSIMVLSNITGYSISPEGLSGSSGGNTTIKNNIIINYIIGIVAIGDKLYVINNTLDGGYYYYSFITAGVYIIGSNNTISYNTYINNTIGILGEYLNYSNIDNNDFYNNDISIGIILSQRNQIRNNSIDAGSLYGVILDHSSNNKFYNNSITNSDGDAIYVADESNDNIFYFNNLKNNVQNAFDSCTNIWYNQEYSIGNYWDDYSGSDSNGDGIGDNSYDINGSTNQDLYPLMYERTVPPLFVWINKNYNSSTPGYNVDHFDKIQKGVDNLTENGSIYVYNGTYYENILIYKSINLQGENKNTVIINNSNNPVVNITSNNVLIAGFTIENSSFSGIMVLSENVTIENNIIRDNSNYGIGLMGVGNVVNNTVTQNIVYNNGYGISVLNNYNTVQNNYVFNNSIGIYLTGVNHCIIDNNTIDNNDLVILVSENNTIICNNFKNKIGTHCVYVFESNNNDFYHNNFLNNLLDDYDNGSNNWNTYFSGNYWDKFDEPSEGAYDNNSDGIIDTPYNISGGNNQDLYPLTGPWGERPYQSVLISPANGAIGVSTSPTLKVSITDPNNDTLNVSFYKSGGSLIGTDTNLASGNTASVIWSGLSYSTSYSWYVIVNDSKYLTRSDTWSFTTQQQPGGGTTPPSPGGGFLPPIITNNPPFANAGGPYVGGINSAITFDGSGSFDSDGDTLTYTWDFGDGSTATGVIITHIYTSPGTYTVTLTVSDGKDSDTDSTTATITYSGEQNPPVANAGGPYTGLTFEIITFDGSKSYDSDGNIVNYTWDFGDESTGYGKKPVHSYNVQGIFNITLTVIDDDGLTDSDTTTINILLDSDGDGISDQIEELIGSDPEDSSDVLLIYIDNNIFYLVDIDKDGTYDYVYNPTGRLKELAISKDGRLILDVYPDTEWDYFYDPLTSDITAYQKTDSLDEFPWIIIIILIIIIIVILIIFILYKKGYITIEEYYE